MKTIPLNHGKVAIVDDEDFEYLSKFKWYAHCRKTNSHDYYYAARFDKLLGRPVFMHRHILKPSKKMKVDHVDGNGLDNRKQNIRICTHAQNMANRRKFCKSSSKFKGVYRHKNKWAACIGINNKTKHIGVFSTEEEAHSEYMKKAKQVFGDFTHD